MRLPFKPTALRGAPKVTPSSSNDDDEDMHDDTSPSRRRGDPYGKLRADVTVIDDGDDTNNDANGQDADDDEDTLALFRRAREMAPIVEADRERRLRRQRQKQQEEAQAEEARRRTSAGSKHELKEETPTPTPTPTAGEETIMATQEEDSRDLVTPPPSKRSRLDTSTSPGRHRDAELYGNTASVPDSPTIRAKRSAAPDRSVTPALFNTSTYSAAVSVPASSSTSSYNTRSQQSRRGPPPGSQVISLDSDSEPETTPKPRAVPPPPAPVIDDALTLDLDLNAADDDDDEFAEYVRKAQEQRDKLLAANQDPSASTPTPTTPFPNSSLPPASAAAAAAASTPTGLSSPAPSQPNVIEIVITSEVPGTRNRLVKFRFDRPLRVVRDTWTALQRRDNVDFRGLLDRDDDVVLTWRRRRVYMTSTLLSLGIRPGGEGDGGAAVVVADGYGGRAAGLTESRARVHMEAWTPALFASMEAEEELRRRRDAGEISDEEVTQRTSTQNTADSGGVSQSHDDEEDEAVKLRVILKARDAEPVRLMIRPETVTETLVAAFRAQRGVEEGREVALWFDGMRLEEGATMGDAEIDDLDTIEVHVK